MKEQERKLQLQGSTKDAHLHKLGEMEDSCKTLTKTVGDLQDQHQMLQNEGGWFIDRLIGMDMLNANQDRGRPPRPTPDAT